MKGLGYLMLSTLPKANPGLSMQVNHQLDGDPPPSAALKQFAIEQSGAK